MLRIKCADPPKTFTTLLDILKDLIIWLLSLSAKCDTDGVSKALDYFLSRKHGTGETGLDRSLRSILGPEIVWQFLKVTLQVEAVSEILSISDVYLTTCRGFFPSLSLYTDQPYSGWS